MLSAEVRMNATQRWRPRGVPAWSLTLFATLLAAAIVVIAFYVVNPISWTSLPGTFAVATLLFPLHALLVTIVAVALAVLAWRMNANLAAALFAAVVVVSAILALWPTIAMWRLARQEHVSLSLGEYLRNATRIAGGGPDPARSVQYGVAPDGTKLMLDVWLPEDAVPGLQPVVVQIHGGGWIAGTRGEASHWNRWLNERGYVVFDLEYRMPPPERWKDEVADVKCALGWVVANATKYQLDPARISTMGFSAGGHLAMLAAYSVDDPELPASCDVPRVPIRSVINLYGPVDLPLGYDSSGSLEYVRDCLTKYVGGSPREFPDRYRLVSPVTHIGANTPPTITFLGTSDRIVSVDQAEVLELALTRAGVAHETYLLPANDHGFDFSWGSFGSQFARAKVEDFLRRQR